MNDPDRSDPGSQLVSRITNPVFGPKSKIRDLRPANFQIDRISRSAIEISRIDPDHDLRSLIPIPDPARLRSAKCVFELISKIMILETSSDPVHDRSGIIRSNDHRSGSPWGSAI